MAHVGSMEGGEADSTAFVAGWRGKLEFNIGPKRSKIFIECEFFCLSFFDRFLDRFWNPEPIQISWLASKAWDDVGGRGTIWHNGKII